MKKLLLTSVAALLLATGTANAMPHDLSETWCAKHGGEAKHSGKGVASRAEYYAQIERCHRRHGTKPCWGLHWLKDYVSCKVKVPEDILEDAISWCAKGDEDYCEMLKRIK
jgi:hypothetical protein